MRVRLDANIEQASDKTDTMMQSLETDYIDIVASKTSKDSKFRPTALPPPFFRVSRGYRCLTLLAPYAA